MPELPEVQTVINDLIKAGFIGKTISDAEIFWKNSIAQPSAEEFRQTIPGQTIFDIRRRAKYIIFDFQSGLHLLIHLRMSGKIQLIPPNTETAKHEHVILHFHDTSDLRFHDTRKFGRLFLVNDPNPVIGHLGPEPLDDTFTVDIFKKRIQSKNRQLKPLLLDQTFIAGLGNIYTDEALWEAKLHPQQIASKLSGRKLEALYHAIRFVLQKGIVNLGTTLGNGQSNFYSAGQRRGRNAEQLNVFHRTGQPCPRCNTIIERIIVGQRSTHICPKCQKH
jgi:formamidopyrimidine-DNA glycosylase